MPVYFFGQTYRTFLSETEGDVVRYEELPQALSKPLVIAEDGHIEAIKSGGRSAIYTEDESSLDSRYFRIKGCIPTTELHESSWNPKGGLLSSLAEREIERAFELGEVLKGEGLEPCYHPVGIYQYDMFITTPYKEERLAAPIFEIKGETRLADWDDHLLPPMAQVRAYNSRRGKAVILFPGATTPKEVQEDVPREVASIREKFAMWAGYLKRIMDTHNYTWGLPDANYGNYVMIGEGKGIEPDTVSLGITDFENCKKWVDDFATMRQIQGFEFARLVSELSYERRGFERGYKGEIPAVIRMEEIKTAAEAASRWLTIVPKLKGKSRNLLCPCGSDLKYKKCHGRLQLV